MPKGPHIVARTNGAFVRGATRALTTLVFVAGPVVRSVAAQQGLTTIVRTVALSATKNSTLSVSIVSGATQTMANLTDNAVNGFATPVRITTTWDVAAASTNSVRLVAWFGTPAQALANGTNYIASSRMRGRVQTAPVTTWQPTTWTAFTQNGTRGIGVNGGTLRLFNIPITAANFRSSRTLDLELQIDLTGQPSTTAGTYSGTITVRAVTT